MPTAPSHNPRRSACDETPRGETSTRQRRLARLKRTAGRLALVCTALAIAEVALRIGGFRTFEIDVDAKQLVRHEPHPVYGWRSKSGRYYLRVPGRQRSVVQSVLPTGWRITRALSSTDRVRKKQVVFLGCSFVFGHGLSDDETLPWQTQTLLGEYDVLNRGVEGYGTYQALLLMEHEFARQHPDRSDVFVYAFSQFHENRNVADVENLALWARQSATGNIRVPYCTLDQSGEIVRHAAESYPGLPGRESLALVALLEEVYMAIRSRSRLHTKRGVTEALLLLMDRRATSTNSQLIVLLQSFDDESRNHYRRFLKQRRIAFIDGAHPDQSSKAMQLPHDSHPNKAMNAFWAKQCADALSSSDSEGSN